MQEQPLICFLSSETASDVLPVLQSFTCCRSVAVKSLSEPVVTEAVLIFVLTTGNTWPAAFLETMSTAQEEQEIPAPTILLIPEKLAHHLSNSIDVPPFVYDIWTWPLPEPIFAFKMNKVLQNSDLIGQKNRQLQILMNQKQLFLKQKKKLEDVIKSIPLGIIMVDANNHISVINKKAKEIIGLELQRDVHSAHHLRETFSYYPFDHVRGMEKKEGVLFEEKLTLPTGNFMAKMVFVKDYNDEYIGTLILFHDLEEGKSYRQQAEELIDTVLHEIRTPITTIVTSLEILEREIAQNFPPKFQRILALSKQNCSRLINLSNDYLDISRIESGYADLDIEELSLCELLIDIYSSFELTAKEKDISIHFTQEHKNDRVLVDPLRFRQVCNNLISNAVKFSPSQKAINMTTKDITLEGRCFVHICIQNFGPRIPEEDQQKLFDRFFRSSVNRRKDRIGSGLGLHISKLLITAMEGDIWIKSDVEEGTRFFFTVPCAGSLLP